MNKTAYKEAEVARRAKECGPAYAAAFEACVVSREHGYVWVDRDRPEWAEVKRIGATKAARPRSRGLGDTIAKITSAVGIKPCGGCKGRQAALNKMVPYK